MGIFDFLKKIVKTGNVEEIVIEKLVFSEIEGWIERKIRKNAIKEKEIIFVVGEKIGNFIKVFGFISGLTASAEASNKILTAYNIIQAKERAGIERAVLTNTFSADAFGPGMYEKFIALIAAQEAFLAGFATTASDEQKKLFATKMRDNSVAEVERMRQIAKDHAMEGNFNVDAEHWFTTITLKINLFKEVEDELALDLAAFTSAGATAAQRAVVMFSLLGVLAIIGSIGISLIISQSILKCLERISYIMGKVSSGILTEKLELDINDELGDVGKTIDLMITNLSELITSLRGSATQVGEASNNISASSEQLAAGSEEQQAQLSEVATTMEEMSAMILESSNNAGETLANAQKTDEIAESGRESVLKTVTGFKAVAKTVETASAKIQEQNDRSEEIGNVIQVIDDIADQTNLLALNANIEAARAGDAGRGFAVVADEVRKLAERTVAATAEIGKMVESIQRDIQEAVGSMEGIQEQSHNGLTLVTEAEKSLNSIADAMKVSVKAVEQIATATNEQSAGAEVISKNVEGVSTVAKESATSAQALATSAEQLNQEVNGLNELVAQFEV